jgi:hypothetical protein
MNKTTPLSGLRTRKGTVHLVHRGQVTCPLRGRIDMEICFYCPFMDCVNLDTRPFSVRCTPPRTVTPEERRAYERYTVLELAEILRNVSEACRQLGIPRRKYYEYKQWYLHHRQGQDRV